METPKILDVDILVANYNNASFLDTFFNSVIHSTVWPKKLVIVNDASSDDSERIIRSYAKRYSFICPIYLEENKGFANALNVGIDYLNSTYTLRIDPDDYMYSNRIEAQYNFISANGFDVVGSNIQYFDSSSTKQLFKSNVVLSEEDIIMQFKSGACGIIHGSTIIKTSLLKKYKYTQANVPAEDYELFSKIILDGGHVVNMEEVLTAVRVHMNSVSNCLPFSTIKKTFDLTESMWGIHHTPLFIRIRYIHLKYYRRFLYEHRAVKKYSYLVVSCLMAPMKVLKRFFK